MHQHPKITLAWALRSLERAVMDLSDSPAEARVRRQFHQLILALERHSQSLDPMVHGSDDDGHQGVERTQ